MSAHDQIQDLQSRMAESIIGQEDVVERIVIGLLANGNILVEGGSSFVFFPNIEPGQATISITPPENVSCSSYPAGNNGEGFTVDVYADTVSIAVFQCQ